MKSGTRRFRGNQRKRKLVKRHGRDCRSRNDPGRRPVGGMSAHSSDRLYLNVCIGLRIAGGKTLPRNVRVMGRIVADSAVQVIDAVRAAPGRAGRGSRRCGARLYSGSYVKAAFIQSARLVVC